MERKATRKPKDPISFDRARRRLSGNRTQRGMQQLRKVICDPARLGIIEALSASELCVNDLSLAIDRAPAATSQHLRVLRNMDLVAGRRRGTTVYYSLKPGTAAELEHVLSSIARHSAAAGG
ncbi:MAG TPA: metalloregulator ArsR/SmtB family transcription factor [Chloroflexota bacterium]|nr:metalloregulator ArsR/SmtB family transcription factor [Chloroflexota bacterium]